MKPVLIKIDKSSISENPNAGQQDYIECVGESIGTFEINEAHKIDFRGARLIAKKGFTKNGRRVTNYGKYLVLGDNIEKFIKYLEEKDIKDVTYNITIPHQEVHSMRPEPKYFYNYQETDVQCYVCGQVFDYSRLMEEVSGMNEDGDDVYEYNICPFCFHPNCCQYEFEKIEDVIHDI